MERLERTLRTQVMTFPDKGQTTLSGDPDYGVDDNMYDFFGSRLKDEGFAVLERQPHPAQPDYAREDLGVMRLRFVKIPHWRDERRRDYDEAQAAESHGRYLELVARVVYDGWFGQTLVSGDPDGPDHAFFRPLADLVTASFPTLELSPDPVYEDLQHHHHGAFDLTVVKLAHWRDEQELRFQRGDVAPVGVRSRPSPFAERLALPGVH